MKAEPKPIKSVIAYACGVCGSVHSQKSEAEEHCRCEECGGQFTARPDGSYFSRKCDRCHYTARVKAVKEEVARHKERLESSEDRLNQLLAEGRPAALPGARSRRFAPIKGAS